MLLCTGQNISIWLQNLSNHLGTEYMNSQRPHRRLYFPIKYQDLSDILDFSKDVKLLHLASELGCEAIVKLVLSKGADINAADSSGQTPLYSAAWHRHTEIVQLLLSKGADINAADSSGQTM